MKYILPIFFVFISLLLLFSGCVVSSNNSTVVEDDVMSGKTISFTTEDGITLVGTLWETKTTQKPPLVLVHQFARDRHTYDSFAQEAFKRGFTVLSFDVRGFGESVLNGNTRISFSNFTENDFRKISTDILSARQFLGAETVLVVGASIGANSALNFGVLDSSASGLVLLSPGENFKGIDTNASAKKNTVPFLVVASNEDQYSNESSQRIFDSSPLKNKKLLILQNAGHGTDMLIRNVSLSKNILDWLDEHA
jgi:pimeloyl-ACP methyl ester carboxylesterase